MPRAVMCLTRLGRDRAEPATRVAGLDLRELHDIYASRILLETLALSMTIGHFGSKARSEARPDRSELRAR